MFRVKALLLTMTLAWYFFPYPRATAQNIRIMPMGNSITYDDNVADNTNPRNVGDRISYRYRLFQLINEAGYAFDFVGSENSGNNYFQNAEYDDNAGFPGITDDQLAYLITSGYNLRAAQYEAPGPYLLYYPADIILLHIGTNALDSDPGDVENILDNIRLYDNDVIVLVARIINRNPYSSLTTTFNNNVEVMVNSRNDDRIIMVNMETGAGINYSTEMADYLHPDVTGYNKMAAKWFEAIENLNTSPEISTIPQQNTTQGVSFAGLNLDDFVTDLEDNDNQIEWTFELQTGTKFNATIDGNRVIHVTITDNTWYGNENILLKAKDSGSGSFRKTDSVSVIFNVIKANEPPVITSTPITSTNEDSNYNYAIEAIDNDFNTLIYTAIEKPEWLTFSSSTHALTGRPTNNEVGTYSIVLRVSDGDEFVDQNFELVVNNINDLPVIISVPVTTIKTGQAYIYEFMATDIDILDELTYSFVSKPAWLSFTPGIDKGILYGSPTSANLGANSVILKVSDGHADILHGFTINVTLQTPVNEIPEERDFLLYPNPAQHSVYIKLGQPSDFRIVIYNLNGILLTDISSVHTAYCEIDITKLAAGIYIYKAFIGDRIIEGKLVKTE